MSADKLVIALTKGRILEEVLPLLEKAGIIPAEDINNSRKLIFESNLPDVQIMVIRGSDVPTYVELGSADVGITGKDILMENGSDGFYEPLDLKLATCRMMTAAPVNQAETPKRLRVASKFVNIAKNYFSEHGRQVDIIKLNGALELAPIMGLADCIVDIVDTGNTLRANGMVPLEHIADISSRLVVNKAAMRTRHNVISGVIEAVSRAVAKREASAA